MARKANSAGASFAAAGDDQALRTLTTAGGAESVSFSLAGAAGVTGAASGLSVTYPGILPGTDVTETATATGISEALTLHSADVATSWVFPLKLTGLTATLNGDSVDLTDSSGNVVWVIPPAVARSGPVDLATADSQASSQLTYQMVSYGGGPALEITRDYNSQDPRTSGAFGAGWASVLDMKVSPGQDGASGTTATEVVTYPDGEQVAFGLTGSGTYAAPPGRYAALAAVPGGGFTLTGKNDTVYTFTQSLGSGVYGITSIAGAMGHTETFTYNSSGEITTMTSASGRTLTVAWGTPSGASYPHVASVVTDDATAGDSPTAQTWGYAYSGDELTTVCPPVSTTACTAYAYTPGSDYQEAY